jgi:imidazolonepropionase
MPKVDILIYNAGQVVTFPHKPLKKVSPETAGVREGFAIAIKNGKIIDMGPSSLLRSRYDCDTCINAEGRLVTPGLVDPHTHLIFAGSREDEFELKLMGYSYLEILKRGGGIYKTVRMTREAEVSELAEKARRTLKLMLSAGTTVVEIKSGYGLLPEHEIKILEAAKEAVRGLPIRSVNTLLAHVIPEEYKDDREKYLKIFEDLIKEVAKRGLAKYIDVFCDKGAFTPEESLRILRRGIESGLRARMHADQLDYIGCSLLAEKVYLDSIDHLEKTPPENARILSLTGTVATFTPTSMLAMMEISKPRVIEELKRLGVPIAVGSDYNPNNMTPLQQTAMDLSTYLLGLTPLEALAATTVNAAWSLRVEGGQLLPDLVADVIVWDMENYRWIGYTWGYDKTLVVIVQGKIWKNLLS